MGNSQRFFQTRQRIHEQSASGAASDDVVKLGDYRKADRVNGPAHYTRGSQEAIDIIEEAIQDAPSVETGMLQAQVLKYLLRLWLKDNSAEDAQKARWYLNRLISKLADG